MLQRYPLTVRQAVDQGPVYLLNRNLQEVVSSGTARGLSAFLPAYLNLAGKTGTTDELRDSWFAGFDNDRVAVVWIGRDDNSPAGLSGAQGAMQVWGDLMRRFNPDPLNLPAPTSVEQIWVDAESGLLADEHCTNAVLLPYLRGSAPVTRSSCINETGQGIGNFFEVCSNERYSGCGFTWHFVAVVWMFNRRAARTTRAGGSGYSGRGDRRGSGEAECTG